MAFNEVFSLAKITLEKLGNPNFSEWEFLQSWKKFGKPKCNEVSVKFLLADPSRRRECNGVEHFFPQKKSGEVFLLPKITVGAVVFTYFNINFCRRQSIV